MRGKRGLSKAGLWLRDGPFDMLRGWMGRECLSAATMLSSWVARPVGVGGRCWGRAVLCRFGS